MIDITRLTKKRLEQVTDAELVDTAAEAAREHTIGRLPSPAVQSLLRAIASTRTDKRRRELAAAAAEKAGDLTDAALTFLRVAIFALA